MIDENASLEYRGSIARAHTPLIEQAARETGFSIEIRVSGCPGLVEVWTRQRGEHGPFWTRYRELKEGAEKKMDIRERAELERIQGEEREASWADARAARKIRDFTDWLARDFSGYTPRDLEKAGIKAQYGESSMEVWGECPVCGDGCWSYSVQNFAQLGKELNSFRPGYAHRRRCSGKADVPDVPDIAERLADLLRELLDIE